MYYVWSADYIRKNVFLVLAADSDKTAPTLNFLTKRKMYRPRFKHGELSMHLLFKILHLLLACKTNCRNAFRAEIDTSRYFIILARKTHCSQFCVNFIDSIVQINTNQRRFYLRSFFPAWNQKLQYYILIKYIFNWPECVLQSALALISAERKIYKNPERNALYCAQNYIFLVKISGNLRKFDFSLYFKNSVNSTIIFKTLD